MEKTEKFKINLQLCSQIFNKTPRISSRVKMVYIVNAQSQNDKGKSSQKLRRWWNMSVFSALVRFRQAQCEFKSTLNYTVRFYFKNSNDTKH